MNYILDSNKYFFTVREEGVDIVVDLMKEDTEQKKVFRITNKSSVSNMMRHMSSLTESQCDQWFKGLR